MSSGTVGLRQVDALRIAAGVERQDEGSVAVDGRVVSEGRTHLPPEKRAVGLMFQDSRCFRI